MLTSMNSIIDRALTLPRQTVAVACAQDEEALRAVAEAHSIGLADFILVGNTDKIRSIADTIELDLAPFELLDARGEACGAAATVRVVASGRAQILLKGFVDSSVLFKAVLDRDAGLRNGCTVSHTVVMDVPGFDKLYLLTDAAMIIRPDLQTKREIVLNAVKVARALGNADPVVGVLCESEKVNPKMPATMDASALVEMNRTGALPGCRVGGPYALDNAISEEAARHKGMDDPLAGKADILLAPDLAAGNIFYKSLMYFARARSAGVVMGTRAPVLLNSRADSHQTKINAVALGILMAAGGGAIMKILVINPGSTSTKIAVYADEDPLFTETIRHEAADLARFGRVMDQEAYRREMILGILERQGILLTDLDAVIGRGGLLRPMPGGTYAVGPEMLDDLRSCSFGAHASNLGAILAHDLAANSGIPALIADPVVVDELGPLARYSGHPDIKRRSIFHALNHKAVARRVARELGRPYDELRLVVAHLGGGVSVGAHELGRVVDVNNALDGDGPFSPERSGGLPTGDVVSWCFAPGAHEPDVRRKITGAGGLLAYLGTASGLEIEKRILAGDETAREVREAMAYQVAKEIGAMGAVLGGRVDAVVLTGGLMHDRELARLVSSRVTFLGPVVIHAGEDEMSALAQAAKRALADPGSILAYPPRAQTVST